MTFELVKVTEPDTSYNGWSNYETWNVNLWLSNDEPTYKYCVMLSKTFCEPIELAKRLEQFVLGFKPEIKMVGACGSPTGVFSDLLNAALSEVNWREIAESYIDAHAEN